ncbi:hypothetical protein GTQ40_02835 [Flavobacteriaceae bacterium R38]|nr:hypothetical protein [Flavobacteriaceae bacterium R38]
MVCKATFKNSKFDNVHAGSGFLLRHNNKTYAITAKHVLFFAKTDSMKTISFGDELKSWTLYSKQSKSKIIAGKLINENPNEAIVMPPKGDWLIFETTDKLPKNMAIYTLRDTPLKQGEDVKFMGYPYKSESPIRINGSFIGLTKDNNLKLDVPNGNYGGCSGGPVIDSEGKLVGIVSMGYFNQKEQKYVFEPASLDYFRSIIEKYQSNRSENSGYR